MEHPNRSTRQRRGTAWAMILALLLCFTALLGAGCAGQAGQDGLGGQIMGNAEATAAGATQFPGLTHTVSGFRLSVLPESFLGAAPSGRFRLDISETRDGITVRVLGAGLVNQRAFYATLRCPADTALLDAQAGAGLGPAAELIQLCLQRQNVVTLGAVLQHCDKRQGVSGDVELACARFKRGPAPANTSRQVCAVPGTTASHPVLRVNNTQQRIEWDHRLPGDYTQNGVVDAGDLTPLGIHWGEAGVTFPDSVNRFVQDSIQDVIDTSGDEQLGLPDVTAIGVYFDTRITGWNLYRSPDPAQDFPEVDLDDPAGDGAAPSKIARFANRDFSALQIGDPAKERLRFAFKPSYLINGMAYWVRPVEAGAEGTPSNWSPYDAGLVNEIVGQVDPESYYGVSSGTLEFEFTAIGADEIEGVLWAKDVDTLRVVSANVRFDGAALDFVPFPEGALMRDPAGVSSALSSIYEIPNQVLASNANTYDVSKPGLSGTFPVWRLQFARAPQSGQAAPQVAGYAPSRGYRSHDISFDAPSSNLTWYYATIGDMNQNGLVSGSDLILMGFYWTTPGPYPINSNLYMIDTNHDGYLQVNDINYTGINNGRAITGYNIYSSPDPNVAPFNADVLGDPGLVPIGYVSFLDAQGDRRTDRLHFSFHVPGPAAGTYLWVQPEYRGEIGGVMHGDCVQVP